MSCYSFESLSLKCHTTTSTKRQHKISPVTPIKLKRYLISDILLLLPVRLISICSCLVHPSELNFCLSSMGDDSVSAWEVPVLEGCSCRDYKGYCCLNCIAVGLSGCTTFSTMGRKGRKKHILIDSVEHISICQANQIP